MPVSAVMIATRAFVQVLLAMAKAYRVAVTVNRESPVEAIRGAYKRVVLKVHPDKGGRKEHMQRLQAAKDAWDTARCRSGGRAGRPASTAEQRNLALQTQRERKDFRVEAEVVLLTYQGFSGLAHWRRFIAFVRKSLVPWTVDRWCATLESCETEALHVHLALKFKTKVDRTARAFAFDGLIPNVRRGDYLGEGLCKRRYEQSVNRGFWYVYADKVGTRRDTKGKPCFAGNHVPVWEKAKKGQSRYAVLGKWCENLWKERKLDHETYEHYLYLSRDGVLSRKRNLDEVRQWEEAVSEKAERVAATSRVRARLFQPFEEVAAATAWLSVFKQDLDRYPILIVLAPSRAGKTEWAKSLFRQPLVLQVGELEHFPDGMRSFRRKYHDGLVLDDLRDMYFLIRHQEKVQGKVDVESEFASTPSGNYAYSKWLWKVPVVVTANYTTRNLDLLRDNDFLANEGNRVLVERLAPPGQRARAA